MNRLAMSLAVLAFVFNPGFACTGEDEPAYQYGESEMKSAVEGTWVLSVRQPDGIAVEEITVAVVESSKAQPSQSQSSARLHSGLIRSAAACGTRTFVASAQACIDSSEMPLDVTFVAGPDNYENAPMSGQLAVHSLIFSLGHLQLTLGGLSVNAEIGPDGSVLSANGRQGDGTVVTVVSLARSPK